MPNPSDFTSLQLCNAINVYLSKNANPTVKTVRRGISVILGMHPKALDIRKEEIKILTQNCFETWLSKKEDRDMKAAVSLSLKDVKNRKKRRKRMRDQEEAEIQAQLEKYRRERKRRKAAKRAAEAVKKVEDFKVMEKELEGDKSSAWAEVMLVEE